MRSPRHPRLIATAALACAAFAAPAPAQDGSTPPPAVLSPPTPGKPDEPPVVMNYLTMLIILSAAIGANMIPSKRGHQD